METIIVTGGAGRIGVGIVRRLHDRPDATVCVVDEDAGRLAGIGAELSRASLRRVDVTDSGAMESLLTEVSDLDRLDAVIANAGVSCVGSAREPDSSRWRRAIEVNSLGVMYTVRAALERCTSRVSVPSPLLLPHPARLSYVGEPAYVVSKHATVAFCDAVRKEIVGSRIRMCVVEPGLVDTPMSRSHPMIDEVLGHVTTLDVDNVARAFEFVLDQPPHCTINEIHIRPTSQDL